MALCTPPWGRGGGKLVRQQGDFTHEGGTVRFATAPLPFWGLRAKGRPCWRHCPRCSHCAEARGVPQWMRLLQATAFDDSASETPSHFGLPPAPLQRRTSAAPLRPFFHGGGHSLPARLTRWMASLTPLTPLTPHHYYALLERTVNNRDASSFLGELRRYVRHRPHCTSPPLRLSLWQRIPLPPFPHSTSSLSPPCGTLKITKNTAAFTNTHTQHRRNFFLVCLCVCALCLRSVSGTPF